MSARRIPTQVHQQVGRLLYAGGLKQEPRWYKAVLSYPPLPLPARSPPERSTFDAADPDPSRRGHTNRPKALDAGPTKPLPVKYLEDNVRRRFFRDHPFEAYRDKRLVESDEIEDAHPIQGKEWTRLRQHGRNPCPEDAVQFAVNLHQAHSLPLSRAYAISVAQYRSLRAEHATASNFAALEAEAYGATWGPGEVERGFEQEEEHLRSFESRAELEAGLAVARRSWKAVAQRPPGAVGGSEGEWTRGKQYQRLWKEGVRPDYAPALTAPAGPVRALTAEEFAATPDFMGVGGSQQNLLADPIHEGR